MLDSAVPQLRRHASKRIHLCKYLHGDTESEQTLIFLLQIGLAMRIALSLGMNREPPRDLLDEAEFRRRRRAWWTLYIIDRKLTLIVGAPLSIRDEDIDISMPDPDEFGTSNAGLIMHIRLANLEGQVKQSKCMHFIVEGRLAHETVSAAYSIDSTVDKTFVHGLQQIFAYMGNLAKDFTGLLSLSLQNPKRVSRTAATLHIMYHQVCVYLAREVMLIQLGCSARSSPPDHSYLPSSSTE